ncbi:MAG: plasmid pRiA4b ORF-3 family protein, partial [Candidatus Eremiobacterota bacterium]
HLHSFEIHGQSYGVRAQFGEDWGDFNMRDERRVHLERDLRKGDLFTYTYDFGDNWLVELRVLDVRPAQSRARPCCLAGQRSGPPEDSGGTRGYQEMLEALADPSHPQHDELSEWVGPDFDPERFDLEGVNRGLAKL